MRSGGASLRWGRAQRVREENRMAGTGSRAACGKPMPPCIGPVFAQRRILAGALVCGRFNLPAFIEQVPDPPHTPCACSPAHRRAREFRVNRLNIKQRQPGVSGCSKLVPLHCNMHSMRAMRSVDLSCAQRNNATLTGFRVFNALTANVFLFRLVQAVFHCVVEVGFILVARLALILQYGYRDSGI